MVKMFIFALGAAVGSFLNVCIHRLPKGESLFSPGSHCPNCNKAISWYDNVPVVSYIILRGKCRSCGAKISPRYIIVELLTASAFLLFFMLFGFDVKFFVYSALASALIAGAFIDFTTQEIPDAITLGGLACGLALSIAFPSLTGEVTRLRSFLFSLAGSLTGCGIIVIVKILWKVLRKEEAMGDGDAKLMAMLGSFLGWKLVMLAFFIAPFMGLPHAIMVKLKKGERAIPYGPYLSLGAIIALLYGDKVLKFIFWGM